MNNDNFVDEGSVLREQARLMSVEVERKSHEILKWGEKLADLEKEIRSTEEYLRCVVEGLSKHQQAT